MTRNLHIGIIQLCLTAGPGERGIIAVDSFIMADLMYDTHSFLVLSNTITFIRVLKMSLDT